MMIRSVAEFLDEAKGYAPTQVEMDLIAACQNGRALVLGGLPAEGDKSREIRADLLRLLATGGTPECRLDPKGVILVGAYISGMLDLQFTICRGRVVVHMCRFAEEPNLTQAEIAQLSLDGSHLPGLFAQGIRVSGGLFLRGLTATGTVDVAGARIAGPMACESAALDGGKDGRGSQNSALNAQGAEIDGGLFLRNLTATGTVDLNTARIAGHLACDGATLDGGRNDNGSKQEALNAQGAEVGGGLFLRHLTAMGTVNVSDARIAGQMNCMGARLDGGNDYHDDQLPALIAERLRVTASFIFRRLKSVTGQVYLDAAHVGDLVDDFASWPKGDEMIFLNGFTYDRIWGNSQTFTERMDWLSRGSHRGGRFYPLLYTQFARELRDTGQEGESRLVLRERERLLAVSARLRDRNALHEALNGNQTARADAGPIWLRMQGARLWSFMTGAITGYGRAPGLAMIWSLGICALATIVYAIAWDFGLMVPTSAVILTSADWTAAVAKDARAPALHLLGQAGKHYETFYAIPYALDVFLPVIDLGQHTAWTQTTATPFWGAAVRVFTWAVQFSGYIVTGLGLAAATGYIQRDKD
ncbi:MAG: hypothetical protein ACT4N9_10305 [Paracoccaceae bacterium]